MEIIQGRFQDWVGRSGLSILESQVDYLNNNAELNEGVITERKGGIHSLTLSSATVSF
jgi:hypothetical protein